MKRRTFTIAGLTFALLAGLLGFALMSRPATAGATLPLLPQAAPAAQPGQSAITGTLPISGTAPLTGTAPITGNLTPVQAQPVVTVTVVVTVTAPAPAIATPTAPAALPVVALRADELLTGTIVVNRTDGAIFFFLGNDLYELPGQRATGLLLERPLAGLTLYTCAADVTDDPACDWLPYPIRRGAMYEVRPDPAVENAAQLRLGLAAPPPLDVAWIQNRTGAEGTLLLGETPVTIANTAVISLAVTSPAEALLYLPRCLQTSSQRICEWLPTAYSGGVYYALRQISAAAGINGVSISRGELEPLLVQEALMTPTPTPEPEPVGIFCQTQIPSLNVRSGPGTEFLISGKLRTGDANGGRVLVVGRTESGEWLAVDPRFVEGGWIANVAQWLRCDGDPAGLPVAEISSGRQPQTTQPAPRPVQATPTAVPAQSAPAEPTPTPTPTGPAGLGPEQAMLIATNAFEQPLRFTLDAALHGLPEGSPSEYDLQPGESISFIIRAGRVQFSASTAWRDGAGNAEFEMAEGTTRELFLHFVPLATDPNRWVMRYE